MKKRYIFLIGFIILSVLLITKANNSSALTSEGETNPDSGGLSTYIQWFDDQSGVLIVSSTFPNDSGVMVADITVVSACINPDRVFRLRVWDSDVQGYVNSENEVGIGALERRFSIMTHRDTNELFWIVYVTSENGLKIYAQINLHYLYDPDATYRPVDEDSDSISLEEHEKELQKVKTQRFIGSSLMAGAGVGLGILFVRRIYK